MAKTLVKIFTILTLAIGTIVLVQSAFEVIQTSVNLGAINDYTQMYNENPRKTDAMTEKVEMMQEHRQEIYQSEDIVVRTFSNQAFGVKVFILLVSIIYIVATPLIWIRVLYLEIVRPLKKRIKTKVNRRSSRYKAA